MNAYTGYPQHIADHVVWLRKEGKSVREIEKEVGVSRDYVYGALRRAGAIQPLHYPGRKLTDDQVRELRRLRSEGAFYHVLAKQFGISTIMAWKTCNGWRGGVK